MHQVQCYDCGKWFHESQVRTAKRAEWVFEKGVGIDFITYVCQTCKQEEESNV